MMTGPTPEQLEQFGEYLLGYFGRHLVCLGVRFVRLDSAGKPQGKHEFLACSAFIMRIRGVWMLVTAGHVFRELDNSVKNNRIAIVHCGLLDYLGKDAKVHHPTPLPYETWKTDYICDTSLGLDIGLGIARNLSLEIGIDFNVGHLSRFPA